MEFLSLEMLLSMEMLELLLSMMWALEMLAGWHSVYQHQRLEATEETKGGWEAELSPDHRLLFLWLLSFEHHQHDRLVPTT
jgi:hypothetical protein